MPFQAFFSWKPWGIALCYAMLFLISDAYSLPYPQEVLSDNPITYWRLGESSGTTVVDQKGLNNATYQGSPTLGIAGSNPYDTDTAASFGSTNTQYVIKNPFNSFPGTAITAEFWIKSSNTSTAGTPLSYAVTGMDNEFLLYDYNNLSFYIGGPAISSGVAINDGQWNHIVVTWRSSDGALVMYKNGTAVFSTNHQAGYTIKSGGSLILAQEQDGVGGSLDAGQRVIGALDEVAIYNYTLSSGRVLSHYNATTNVPEPSSLLLSIIAILGSLWAVQKNR